MPRRSNARKHDSAAPAATVPLWRRLTTLATEIFGVINPIPVACIVAAAMFIWFAAKILFPEASMVGIDAKTIPWLSRKDGASFVIREMAARQVWSAAIAAQTLAFLFAICYFASSVFSPPFAAVAPATRRSDRRWLRTSLFLLVAALFGTGVAWGRDSPDQRGGILGAGKVSAALLKHVHELSHVVEMKWVVYVSNGLVAAVIVLGALATSSAVALPNEFMGASVVSARIRLLKAQITALRSQLSVCSAVLVVGVIQISVQYRWPAALVACAGMRQRINELSTATALGAGTAFAILLVSLFGGAGFVLWRRVNDEIARYGEEHPDDDAATRLGLDFSLRDFYYQIAKTLGPLFVAGITAIFNAKGEG